MGQRHSTTNQSAAPPSQQCARADKETERKNIETEEEENIERPHPRNQEEKEEKEEKGNEDDEEEEETNTDFVHIVEGWDEFLAEGDPNPNDNGDDDNSDEKRMVGQFFTPLDDKEYTYGDGGICEANFGHVSISRQLLPMTSRQELAKEIRLLAERKEAARAKTFQQNGVVEDLVDPDFFPALLKRNRTTGSKKNDTTEKTIFSSDHECEGTTERAILAQSDHRGGYAWIPALVKWDGQSRTAKFQSPIQNLPRTSANAKLYTLLEEALSALVPTMLRNAWSLSEDRSTVDMYEHETVTQELKIVVKIQRYHVPPKATYRGKWHTEGVTENVQSVGVLYAEWPKELTGGELRFRPVQVPDDHYREWSGTGPLTMVVPTVQGAALAFGNLPHRFQKLTNATDQPLQRAFVNFFLVDSKLPTTNTVLSNADIALALLRKTNFDIIDEVLSYLDFTPRSTSQAIALREKAKAEMTDRRGKWGYCNFGNCGDMLWLPTGGQEFFKDQYNEWVVKSHGADSTNGGAHTMTESGN